MSTIGDFDQKFRQFVAQTLGKYNLGGISFKLVVREYNAQHNAHVEVISFILNMVQDELKAYRMDAKQYMQYATRRTFNDIALDVSTRPEMFFSIVYIRNKVVFCAFLSSVYSTSGTSLEITTRILNVSLTRRFRSPPVLRIRTPQPL